MTKAGWFVTLGFPPLQIHRTPRRPRLLIAGIALHITQRGVNRGATFIDAEDHLLYRELLTEMAAMQHLVVHAYVLMSNHVHLLITPTSHCDLARDMRLLNQRYVGAFNPTPPPHGHALRKPLPWIRIAMIAAMC
jgi:putative transposase